jgi:hypothetical protein
MPRNNRRVLADYIDLREGDNARTPLYPSQQAAIEHDNVLEAWEREARPNLSWCLSVSDTERARAIRRGASQPYFLNCVPGVRVTPGAPHPLQR